MPESNSLYPAIAVLGPTASGKSMLGTSLAERFCGEIVACDALQVYRHMDIGTAKPTADERAGVPHHMIDLREPCEDFSAGDYQRLGRITLQEIQSRGRIPFVVGGTGFYLKTLIEGLFAGPGRSAELRRRMHRIATRRGPRIIHRALARVDPVAAGRISSMDSERTIRAYEVYLLTGRTISWWQDQPRDRLKTFRWLKLGIARPRPELYQRIDRRVVEMIENGFVQEVQRLAETFPPDCHAFKAIGYRQIAAYLAGAVTLDAAIADTQRESRRYAKRQLTWFRADTDIQWLDTTRGDDQLVEDATAAVSAFLS